MAKSQKHWGQEPWTPPVADESKMVSRMFVPELRINSYDADILREIARHVGEKFGLSASLINLVNCEVVDGVVVNETPLEYL